MARWQLTELGVPARRIDGWVARERLHPLHRGVYRAGPIAGPHAREIAAVLACGPGAAASHASAAHLYELLPHPARPGPVHVTVPKGHARSHREVRVHRGRLASHEIRERHGIPVTAPVRTVLDLASGAAEDELERAIAEAFALRLTTRDVLVRAIVPGQRGAARLRRVLDAGPRLTRSAPERRLLSMIRGAGLPQPQTNVRLGRWEVDLYWPAHRLVVEVDAYSTHSSPRAFERDRRKDAELSQQGLRIQRFSANRLEAAVPWIRRALR